MKKILLLFFLMILQFTLESNSPKTDVYVCTSPNAYVFHINGRCSGLSRCSYSVKVVSIEYAKYNMGRRACGVCCK